MKKLFLFAAALMTGSAVFADTESYSAFDADGNMVSVFPTGEISELSSTVTFSTANMDVVAVSGATPKTVEADGTVSEWNAIKWDPKSQNLQDNVEGLDPNNFFYVVGTGNPYVSMGYEEIMRDGEATGEYRATYVLYGAEDGTVGDKTYKNEMPVSGLYYKFTPKANGTVKVQVWSNKGNRNTLVVEESSKQPIAYTAEGYINGQNEQKEATVNGETVTYNAKKYLSAAEVQEIHDAAKVVDGVDTAPYVIGAGNQAFWGYVTFTVEAGKTYWLFQDSSQIGFGGYEFTTEAGGSPVAGDAESYDACDEAGNMAAVFPAGEIAETESVLNFGTDNIDVTAVSGATPKTIQADGTVTEWNPITWSAKAQNLQDNVDGLEPNNFFYVLGTGNPYVSMGAEEIMRDGEATGEYRATYVLYGAEDGTVGDKTYKNEMPVSGLYYKFTPKVNGTLKVQVWSNKGNRNTLVVEESSKQPIAYTAEGYINGQNEQKEATVNGETVTYNAKKYLSAAEVQEIHDAAKVVDGVDTAPYVIGAGNQAFWGYVTFTVEAGKTYWLFQDSSQIGFGGYEFTPDGGGEVGPGEQEVTYDYYTLTFPVTDVVPASFSDREFSINITDENEKFKLDENNAYFGTEEAYEKFTTRLKTGGKSSSKNMITVNIPAAGKLQIMARSSSSSSVRALVISQNDAEIYNEKLDDATAATVTIDDDDIKIYKVHETDVEAGTATITYPDGAVNFYCIRLAVPQGGAGIEAVVNDIVIENVIFNLRGQRVTEMTPGQIYIINGKKVLR